MNRLITTQYKIPLNQDKLRLSGKNEPQALRLALVTDLHDSDPAPVLRALRAARPDLILVAGDLCERHELNALLPDGTRSPWTLESMNKWMGIGKSSARLTKWIKLLDGSLPGHEPLGRAMANGRRFLRAAGRLAPVYYSVGNHEWYFTAQDLQLFSACNITLLDNADTIATVHGQKIRIGGLSTRYDLAWLQSYAAKPGYKLLLCHHPEYYERYIKKLCLPPNTFDLILAGHAHGGQWRLRAPRVQNGRLCWRERGFYAPGQGLFPAYHHGVYPCGPGRLVVSAGCSNTSVIPRFGNPCEVVLLDTAL